jgi:hypothetical protein
MNQSPVEDPFHHHWEVAPFHHHQEEEDPSHCHYHYQEKKYC